MMKLHEESVNIRQHNALAPKSKGVGYTEAKLQEFGESFSQVLYLLVITPSD